MNGELVGDPEKYNPKRRDGSVGSTGITDALNNLSTEAVGNEDNPPDTDETSENDARDAGDPEEIHVSTATQPVLFNCPVKGCDYKHSSSQGLCGHIPNIRDHRHGWDSVESTPADLHELWSRGTHPNPCIQELMEGDSDARVGTKENVAVETVRAWLMAEDQPIEKLQVWFAPGYDSVQIQPRDYLGDEWDEYLTLMQETDGIYYDGEAERNYCTDEFISGLSASKLGVKLEVDE